MDGLNKDVASLKSTIWQALALKPPNKPARKDANTTGDDAIPVGKLRELASRWVWRAKGLDEEAEGADDESERRVLSAAAFANYRAALELHETIGGESEE